MWRVSVTFTSYWTSSGRTREPQSWYVPSLSTQGVTSMTLTESSAWKCDFERRTLWASGWWVNLKIYWSASRQVLDCSAKVGSCYLGENNGHFAEVFNFLKYVNKLFFLFNKLQKLSISVKNEIFVLNQQKNKHRFRQKVNFKKKILLMLLCSLIKEIKK